MRECTVTSNSIKIWRKNDLMHPYVKWTLRSNSPEMRRAKFFSVTIWILSKYSAGKDGIAFGFSADIFIITAFTTKITWLRSPVTSICLVAVEYFPTKKNYMPLSHAGYSWMFMHILSTSHLNKRSKNNLLQW